MYLLFLGIPYAVFRGSRISRIAWFKWRHSRVPYDADAINYYCRKFNLKQENFKNPDRFMWREDALKSGLAGTYAFFMIAWNTWFHSPAKKSETKSSDPESCPKKEHEVWSDPGKK